ncbi:CarD family transcriptional regulator [Stella humosa]|uniref:CarD family transcriptional regulator n=1 Tax=Stella humosa TaxID=94 RepID=A0A3N1LH28_9PROT|nr:CarD family transcriptional regulator [Stella humosa]
MAKKSEVVATVKSPAKAAPAKVPSAKTAKTAPMEAGAAGEDPAAAAAKAKPAPAPARKAAPPKSAANPDIPAAAAGTPAKSPPPAKPAAESKSGMTAKVDAKLKAASKTDTKPAAETKPATTDEAKGRPTVSSPPALKIVENVVAAAPKAPVMPPLLKPVPKPLPLKVVDGSAEGPGFEVEDHVVYPTHGVGKITAIETQEIAGHILKVFVVQFEKDRMTLRVPVGKVRAAGLRRLSTRKEMDAALAKLRGRSRVKRTMWSRRAQEYEAKINSGDPASIAEVVRDLHRNAGQPDQSYSERQIYQAALDRLARELAAVERIDEEAATQRLEKMLQAAA